MKVILKENIDSLGKKGDIVNVAAGYGRNYLIPKKLALQVTATNMKMIEKKQAALRKGLEKDMASFQSLVQQLNEVTLTFTRKAGDRDAIFGSVSVADVKEALEKLNFNIEKKKILLDDPIKKLGNFTVPIKVFQEERAEVKIEVIKEGAKGEEKEHKIDAEPEPALKAEVEPELQPASESEPGSKPTTEPKTEAEAETQTKTKPKAEPQTEAEAAAPASEGETPPPSAETDKTDK